MEPVRHVPHVNTGTNRATPPLPNINPNVAPSIGRNNNLPLPLNNHPLNNQNSYPLPPFAQLAGIRNPSGNYRPSQTDGACDESLEDKWVEASKIDEMIAIQLEKKKSIKNQQTTESIPQLDGKHDKKRAKTLQNQNFYNDDDRSDDSSSHEEESLNSDDDEDLNSDDDDVDDEQEPETSDLMLCQYEKITRVKNKRKCTLSHGIMHLNGQDYVFQKANGEIDF
eukprot:TRINITY_DN3812_c0_g1_i2.p1 TRINITY_DN3812_c0_g1~~TRINITY_DN3812_c0_g1_i2.p1  ORF type:complete len:224 (-),score=51.82 TRINITY_DN3812_c0_g1_i2:74-745(-)